MPPEFVYCWFVYGTVDCHVVASVSVAVAHCVGLVAGGWLRLPLTFDL